MHTLVVIGYLGIRRAYLDVPKEEALKRFIESEGETPPEDCVRIFQFKDEFCVYDAWGL